MVMFFSGGTIAFDGFSIVFTTSRPMVYNDQRPHPPSKINGQKMGESTITGDRGGGECHKISPCF